MLNADKLKALLDARGMDVGQLHRAMVRAKSDMSESGLRKWFAGGVASPNPADLQVLCDVLGVRSSRFCDVLKPKGQ